MIDLQTMDIDRTAYVEHVQRFWTILKEQGAVQANVETAQSSEISKRWADNGYISEFLTPLLSHETESVRYAAAAGLLNYVDSAAAVNVLNEIANNPQGLIAPTAKLFLSKRKEISMRH